MKKIILLLFLYVLIFATFSCSDNKIRNKYIFPSEFKEFSDCNAHYRVFALYPDTINNKIVIKALMTAYIDTINNELKPTTTYLIKHIYGDSILIQTNDKLIGLEDFRRFVNSHSTHDQWYNDTIISFSPKYLKYLKEPYTNFQDFNLYDLDEEIPFFFLDVSFKGYPSLLVKNHTDYKCTYYDVYSIVSDKIKKLDYPPYNQFKTATSSWMVGYGTNIDYKNKEIIIPSVESGSCSDYGTIVDDHYILDKSGEKFNHRRTTKKYDFF